LGGSFPKDSKLVFQGKPIRLEPAQQKKGRNKDVKDDKDGKDKDCRIVTSHLSLLSLSSLQSFASLFSGICCEALTGRQFSQTLPRRH
jgi:hypothetical protein